MSLKDEILEQFEQTLWAIAWADWQENLDSNHPESVNMSGCEIMDIMPEPPESARDHAKSLFAKIAELNGGPTEFLQAFQAILARDSSSVDTMAHYLVMEACGHGVAYSDDYPEHGLVNIRYLETHTFDGKYLEVYM